MPVRLAADPGDVPLFAAASPQEFARAFRLTPEGAVRYLQGRARVRVTYDWHELWQDEHARAFTVSRLTRADLLEAIRQRIEASVQGDLSRRDFMRDVKAMLREAGWWGENRVLTPDGREVKTHFHPRRLNLIYDVNTRMAYAAGRWERVQAAKASHPFLRYVTRADERVRQSHRQWHNVTLPVDDPWWQTHYPPCGWRCRCTAVALRAKDAEGNPSLKRQAPDEPLVEWKNPVTGELRQVPYAIDPGFGYNVGEAAARWRGLIDAARDKVARYAAATGAGLADDLAPLIERDWAGWVEDVLAGRERNRLGWLGVISPLDLAHLKQAGIEPLSAEVMVRPGLLRWPKAARHARDGDEIPDALWRVLPALFRQARALLVDVKSGKPLWVLPGGGDGTAQLAMQVDFVTGRPKRTTNAMVSAYRVTLGNLRNRLREGSVRLLWGSLE